MAEEYSEETKVVDPLLGQQRTAASGDTGDLLSTDDRSAPAFHASRLTAASSEHSSRLVLTSPWTALSCDCCRGEGVKVSRRHVLLCLSCLLLLVAALTVAALLLPLLLPAPYAPNFALLSQPSTAQYASRCAAFSSPPLPPATGIAAPRIGLLVVGDERAAMRYSEHWQSLRCYAGRWNYTFVVEAGQQSTYSRCSHLSSFFFRKHCLVVERWQLQPDVDWWLVLDGDSFVVSADRPLSDYLPSQGSSTDIVLYERFPTGEVMAGNYLVRASSVSCAFLLSWADMGPAWSSHGFYNADNGALHVHLIRSLWGADSLQWRGCVPLLANVQSWDEYDSFIGCFKCVLGGQRLFPALRLTIVRRGHFLTRDHDVSSPSTYQAAGLVGPDDILFHGWKQSPVGMWWRHPIDAASCLSQPHWTPALLDDIKSGAERVAASVAEMERQYELMHPRCVVSDVGGCWPHCVPTLTVEEERAMRLRLCPKELLSVLESRVNNIESNATPS